MIPYHRTIGTKILFVVEYQVPRYTGELRPKKYFVQVDAFIDKGNSVRKACQAVSKTIHKISKKKKVRLYWVLYHLLSIYTQSIHIQALTKKDLLIDLKSLIPGSKH